MTVAGDAPAGDRESGTMVLWVLGLAVLLLGLGGIGVDLWRAYSERRAVAAVADAAAFAGASALDETHFRATGEVALHPDLATALADRSIRGQADGRAVSDWRVAATPAEVTVVVEGRVDLTLLGLFVPGGALPLEVSAVARPQVIP